jgi:acetyltransferase-like isoleucine patch superfamily enzyme
LLIGLGSTVGTTPAIAINENLLVTTHGGITMAGTTPTLTIGDAGAEDTKIVFDGNAKDFYIALDDSADKLVIGEGSTVGTNSILTITDDAVTIGDAAAVDTKIVFDGNAKDFYIALDDSADKMVIGEGSTVGTNSILTITDDTLTIGDAAAVDTKIVFDGNAQDYYIALDDSADDLLIGLGSTVGTTPAISIDENLAISTYGDITMTGATPTLTIGDAGAEDAKIVFDGNAQDFYVGLDDSADDLIIGKGSALGTTPIISMDENLKTTFGGGAVGATNTANATGSTTLNFDTYQNHVLTATGNITLANPSTESVGQTGFIAIIQDGTGSRTLTLGTDYESPAGGGITLTTTASATDMVPYVVIAANRVALGTPQLAFS